MSKLHIQQPLVSIVILNWNHLEDTKLCLKHLKNLTYQNFEIVLVDNGSKDGSKEYFAKQKGIVYVDNPTNRGFAGGHIDGLAHAKGEYILLLNNDAVTHPQVVENALRNFDDPTVGAVGGRAYFWNENNPLLDESNRFYAYQTINPRSAEALTLQNDSGKPQEVNNVSGSCLMVKREIINSLGYLYEPMFCYYEEADLLARIKRAGYKVLYDPAVKIWHKVGASSNDQKPNFFYFMMFRNRFTFALRNFEFTFLGAFLKSYFRITVGSALRMWRKSPDQGMQQAYVKAALSSLGHLPRTLMSRAALRLKLGKSTYNHKIMSEQFPLSFVFEINTLGTVEKKRLQELADKHLPSNDYVFVVKREALKAQVEKLVSGFGRVVLDKGYFDCHSLTLGAIVARHDWLVLADLQAGTQDSFIQDSVSTIAHNKELLLWATAPAATEDLFTQPLGACLVIHRSAFVRARGLMKRFSLSASLRALVLHLYFNDVNKVGFLPMGQSPTTQLLDKLELSADERHELLLTFRGIISEQEMLSRVPTWLDRLTIRYYRLLQLTNLLRWLATPDIRLRHKLARCKNLVLFSLTLKRKALATELKHIQNELYLARDPSTSPEAKLSLVKKELSAIKKRPQDIPVFIICHDRIGGLKKLVPWLEKTNQKKITFIDNDSKYPDLLEYYKKTPYQVLDMQRNLGHTVAWSMGIIQLLVPGRFYIVTDPDIIPAEDCPTDAVAYFLELHRRFPYHLKIGFGLKIDDLPDHYSLKSKVIEWEEQFWKYELESGLYEASLDTTFALYKPFTYKYTLHPSIRTGAPYVAHHLPWYANSKTLTKEDIFYRLHADQNITNWDSEQLPDRYEKELRKQRK